MLKPKKLPVITRTSRRPSVVEAIERYERAIMSARRTLERWDDYAARDAGTTPLSVPDTVLDARSRLSAATARLEQAREILAEIDSRAEKRAEDRAGDGTRAVFLAHGAARQTLASTIESIDALNDEGMSPSDEQWRTWMERLLSRLKAVDGAGRTRHARRNGYLVTDESEE